MMLEIIRLIIWPVVVTFILTFILIKYRKPLEKLINRMSNVTYLTTRDGHQITLTFRETVNIARELLDQIDRLIGNIEEKDQELLSKIYYAAHRSLTATELFNGKFQRKDEHGDYTKELERLRKLRDWQLIRPVEGGQFQPDKKIEITQFGNILLNLRKEKLLGTSTATRNS